MTALLIGTVTGATLLAYQVVVRLMPGVTRTWMIRLGWFGWLFLSVAGIVAGALVSRRGAAILAQTATGVAAVAVGLLGRAVGTALAGPDLPLYLSLRWGWPPGMWSFTLLTGCVVIGVGAELGFLATGRIRRVWIAVTIAAIASGAAELLFIRALGWLNASERKAADLLVGVSVLTAVVLGWQAGMIGARLRRPPTAPAAAVGESQRPVGNQPRAVSDQGTRPHRPPPPQRPLAGRKSQL